jgi:hypothetical protein
MRLCANLFAVYSPQKIQRSGSKLERNCSMFVRGLFTQKLESNGSMLARYRPCGCGIYSVVLVIQNATQRAVTSHAACLSKNVDRSTGPIDKKLPGCDFVGTRCSHISRPVQCNSAGPADVMLCTTESCRRRQPYIKQRGLFFSSVRVKT